MCKCFGAALGWGGAFILIIFYLIKMSLINCNVIVSSIKENLSGFFP
jgi:hypothetical protein